MAGSLFETKDLLDRGVELYDSTSRPMVEIPDVTVLSEREMDSALWLKIRKSLELMLQKYRIENDSSLSELDTADIRGRIKQVKEFLALGEPPGLEEDPGSPDLGY